MRWTHNRCVPKRLSLVLTILMVTATGVCAQNWTDYNQWVPSTTFPDMGTNWTGLNDPINSWISSPTSSLNNSWITDPGFVQSLRVEHASMMTPTMSSASGYSMTSLFSPLPSVDPMGNRSTLLQSVRASPWLDSGLPSLQAGQLAVSAFDAMTQAGRQLTYPMFEQVAMARVRPQLVQNQMWQELNLVNQGRLKVGRPRLSFEEYYGAGLGGSPATSMSMPLWGGISFMNSAEDIQNLRQVTDILGLVGSAYSETHPSLALNSGIDVMQLVPDILQDFQDVQQGSYYGWAASHTLSGGAGLLYSKLISDVGKSNLSISRYMSGLTGLPKLVELISSYSGRGGHGPLTLREITLGLDAFAITATALAFGPWGAQVADVGLPLARDRTMPAFQAGVNLFYKPRMAEQTRQQELNFRRNNQLRLDQGMQALSRDEFFGSTPGQTRGFLNTFEMARIQSQLAEQQTWREYNRFNERFLELGFKQRISFDDFLNMKSLPPIETEYYRQKRWVINDPTRGMTTIYTHSISRFRISIRGGVCVLSGGF